MRSMTVVRSSAQRPPPGGWLNVTASPYYATGNGVTDDRAAIQAALDAAAAGPIRTVYFPPTVAFYAIGGALVYDSGVRLVGASPITAAIVNLNSRANTDTIMMTPARLGVTDVVIERLTFHQAGDHFDATYGDSTTQMCIDINSTVHVTIQDCYFRYIRTMAVWCDSYQATPTTHTRFVRNHVFEAGGDAFSSFGAFYDFEISDNIIENCEDDAIAVQATSAGSNGRPRRGKIERNQILNCTGRTTYGSTPHGILVQGGSDISIKDNYIYHVFSSGLHLYDFGSWILSNITADNNTIDGTHVGYPGVGATGAPGDGIWLSTVSTTVMVRGNTISNWDVGFGSVAIQANGATLITTSTTLLPASYGAVGNGTTDDTTAMQNAFNACGYGKILVLDPTKTYKHTAVLSINNPGSYIKGAATILATTETTSAVKINADNVTLEDATLKMNATTFRGDQVAEHKLHIAGHYGAVVRKVKIDSSNAAGVFVAGASGYLLEDVTVLNTRADSIHQTGGASFGTVRRPYVQNCGDDGVAVVSYFSDGTTCTRILCEGLRFIGNTWGRGISVAGGSYVTHLDFWVEGSDSAALYLASEAGDYSTYGVSNIYIDGGTLYNANTEATIDHGAVVVWCAQVSQTISDITIRDMAVVDTRTTASRNIGLLVDAGSISRVTLRNLRVTGSGTPVSNVFVNQAGAGGYNSSGWTVNGTPQTAHNGW